MTSVSATLPSRLKSATTHLVGRQRRVARVDVQAHNHLQYSNGVLQVDRRPRAPHFGTTHAGRCVTREGYAAYKA